MDILKSIASHNACMSLTLKRCSVTLATIAATIHQSKCYHGKLPNFVKSSLKETTLLLLNFEMIYIVNSAPPCSGKSINLIRSS